MRKKGRNKDGRKEGDKERLISYVCEVCLVKVMLTNVCIFPFVSKKLQVKESSVFVCFSTTSLIKN